MINPGPTLRSALDDGRPRRQVKGGRQLTARSSGRTGPRDGLQKKFLEINKGAIASACTGFFPECTDW